MLEEGWMKTLATTDFIRSAAVIVLFIVTGFGNKSTWINGQVLFWAAVGTAMIAMPKAIIEGQVKGDVSPMHLFLLRTEGVGHLWFVFLLVTNRKSKDDRFWMATFITGTMLNAGMVLFGLVAQQQLYKSKPGLTATHLTFTVLCGVMCFLGYLYQVLFFSGNARSRVEKSQSSRINIHLIIEVLICLFCAIMDLGYPEISLKEMMKEGAAVDGVLLYQVRCGGAFAVASIVCHLLMLRLDTAHKKTFLKTNLLIDLLCVGLFLHAHYALGLLSLQFMTKTLPVFMGITTLNKVLAIFS